MQAKTTFILLFMLSFSVFHDSFISLIEHHKDVSSYSSNSHSVETKITATASAELTEIHNHFHFMAILSLNPIEHLPLHSSTKTSLSLTCYASPLEKTSYKPPRV